MSSEQSQKVSAWRRRTKEKAIIYKGSSCIVCGYNRCPAALDFHHVDESTKLFAISNAGICRAWLKVKSELDKCVLLCNRCHMEHHHGDLNLEIYLEESPSIDTGDEALRAAGFDPYFSRKERWDIKTNKIVMKDPKKCIDCRTPVYRTSKRCKACDTKRPRKTKIEWPDVDDLIDLVKSTSFVSVARELGVSDNAIRKRIRTKSDVNPKDLV